MTDKESSFYLSGASVFLYSDSILIGQSISDTLGYFRIKKVPIGKYIVKVRSVGYKEAILSNIIVNSGKELILNIEMEEAMVELNSITVSDNEEYINRSGSIRTFSVEESNRYAGSRSDPARMASNFAGVQGSDDSRNDLVIRGNSPSGVLWRYEGVDIPNPNHFAIIGTTGGPVNIINNKVLANSYFISGAFGAEYGNCTAGVFDIKMRNGNNEKHEFTGQFGFLGTEIAAEGPLSSKSGSSYIVAYRYST